MLMFNKVSHYVVCFESFRYEIWACFLQIDHSIVESFGGEGRTCITSRVYPKLAINKEAHLYAFNNGTETVKISRLNGWSMKSCQMVKSSTTSLMV